MSNEAALAFTERLTNDEAFRAKLAGTAGREERMALAREEGFDLGPDDVDAVKTTLGIEELSDEDLERVAGGMGTTTVGSITSAATVSVGAAAALL